MPDYIYLLQNHLTRDQQTALQQISAAARALGFTVFLVGGAVRDLTSGASVRDLDVAVQGNALKLKKPLIKAGATLWGEHEPSRTLHLHFPLGVRVEISSTRSEGFPKPGKKTYFWDDIHADLRRRDFTANAMALSLNEQSYGLLMDPLNGVADIEMRQLRLVSNYGFVEDPIRLVRATRFATRMGWEIEERTRARYLSAKEENRIAAAPAYDKGYELEEIAHEEDALRVLMALENEGWMSSLFPSWTSGKADAKALEEMRRMRVQLELQGVSPDASAISMRLLTAKLSTKDLAALKRVLVRPGFVEEWNRLDTIAREFAKAITSKPAAVPSAAWKMFTASDPQAVLWLGITSKSPAVQEQYRKFTTVWPESRQKIPSSLMLEMRITPEIAGYEAMLREMFMAAIDGKLETEEQMRAFLEPYSPPAPPPPVTVRRSRARKSETRAQPQAAGPPNGEGAPEKPGQPAPVKSSKKGKAAVPAEGIPTTAAPAVDSTPQKPRNSREAARNKKASSTAAPAKSESSTGRKAARQAVRARKQASSRARSAKPAPKREAPMPSKAKARSGHSGKESRKAAQHSSNSSSRAAGKNHKKPR